MTPTHRGRSACLPPYLAGGGGSRARQHRRVGDLHVQVIIVDEGPGALHLAGLEAVCESPEVWVPEEAAVCVVGGGCAIVETLLIVADLRAVRALLAVPWRRQCAQVRLRRGAILGAVVLAHEVLDAMDGRVVGQVAPAGAGRAPRAQGVCAQRGTELGGVVRGWCVAARCGAPELRVALEDLARGSGCEGGKGCIVRVGDPRPPPPPWARAAGPPPESQGAERSPAYRPRSVLLVNKIDQLIRQRLEMQTLPGTGQQHQAAEGGQEPPHFWQVDPRFT